MNSSLPEGFRVRPATVADAPAINARLTSIRRSGSSSETATRSQPCRGDPDRTGAGWIAAIDVRKPWRKRGLGLALLRHAFAEFSRRSQPRVALGVDAKNPTGATRLYERAGMLVAYEAVAYAKDLG